MTASKPPSRTANSRGETVETRFVSIDGADLIGAEHARQDRAGDRPLPVAARLGDARQGGQCDRRQSRQGHRRHRRLDLRARRRLRAIPTGNLWPPKPGNDVGALGLELSKRDWLRAPRSSRRGVAGVWRACRRPQSDEDLRGSIRADDVLRDRRLGRGRSRRRASLRSATAARRCCARAPTRSKASRCRRRCSKVCRKAADRQSEQARRSARCSSRATSRRSIAPLGTPDGFLTGYYEPIVEGVREPTKGYDWPLYRKPASLLPRRTMAGRRRGRRQEEGAQEQARGVLRSRRDR